MQLPPLRRPIVICLLAALLAVGASVLAIVGPASADLNRKISTASGRAEQLRAAVAAETRRIRSSSQGLAQAQARLAKLQANVATEEADLRAATDQLTKARNRLTRLIKRQHEATAALRENLVTAYRNPAPDIVSVIIDAHGFSDLLEKADFLKRVGRQNARIMDGARAARGEVTKEASRLAEAQAHQRDVTVRLESQRNEAQTVESALLTIDKLRLHRQFERGRLRRDDVHQRATLLSGEDV